MRVNITINDIILCGLLVEKPRGALSIVSVFNDNVQVSLGDKINLKTTQQTVSKLGCGVVALLIEQVIWFK